MVSVIQNMGLNPSAKPLLIEYMKEMEVFEKEFKQSAIVDPIEAAQQAKYIFFQKK